MPASSFESSPTSTSFSNGELSTDGDTSRLLFFHFPPLRFAHSTSMRFFFASCSAFFCSLITRFRSFSLIRLFFFSSWSSFRFSFSLSNLFFSVKCSSWIRIASSPDSPLGSICQTNASFHQECCSGTCSFAICGITYFSSRGLIEVGVVYCGVPSWCALYT